MRRHPVPLGLLIVSVAEQLAVVFLRGGMETKLVFSLLSIWTLVAAILVLLADVSERR